MIWERTFPQAGGVRHDALFSAGLYRYFDARHLGNLGSPGKYTPFRLTRAHIIEMAFYPYVVTLQVTPVVAIAPLILIWVGFDNVDRALILIAWIVAFFPMLTNTVQGLRATEASLHELMTLSRASWWQRLIYLELPAALPSILTGAKVSGGLALIGAVVAEFVAGSGTGTGLAWRIIEAGNRLEIANMFAALVLLSLLGILIFYALSIVEWLALRRWHESFQPKST